MKALKIIDKDGVYHIVVSNTDEDRGGSPFAMQIYRNRTRLASTETLHEVRWSGVCHASDVIEADGDRAVLLSVLEAPHAHSPDPGDDDTRYAAHV